MAASAALQRGLLLIFADLALAHYGPPPCLKDERLLVIQQANDWVGCMPACTSDSNCPQSARHLGSPGGLGSVIRCSVDTGATGKYCGETCNSDADCNGASGAACKDGLCLFPPKGQWPTSWQWHILPYSYTGPANKDLADEGTEVGFIAFFCFGNKKSYSDYNVRLPRISTIVLLTSTHLIEEWAPCVRRRLRNTLTAPSLSSSRCSGSRGGNISRAAHRPQRPTRHHTTGATRGRASRTTTAIRRGCHGMTVRHRPRTASRGPRCSLTLCCGGSCALAVLWPFEAALLT